MNFPGHNHALAPFSNPLSWRCDSCHSLALGNDASKDRFRCSSGCDYDVCSACFRGEQVSLPHVHSHALVLNKTPNWACDGCSTLGKSTMKRYRCKSSCDYDLCGKCILDINSKGFKIKDHPHALRFSTSKVSWQCDVCFKTDTIESIRYRCTSSCDYDICGTCKRNYDDNNSDGKEIIEEIKIELSEGVKEVVDKPDMKKNSLHIHSLVNSEQIKFWMCDLCGNKNKDIRWRCNEGCDYDLCGTCFALGIEEKNVITGQGENIDDKTGTNENESGVGKTDKITTDKESEGETCTADSMNECKICFENVSEQRFALVPCGHANYCGDCAKTFKICPYCNTKVVTVMRIYMN